MTGSSIAAGCLLFLAAAHSALGERMLLAPLLRSSWSIPVPRDVAEPVIRFAWHLTSVAWVALAVVVVGVDPLPAVGAMSLLSAAVVFVMLRLHLSWPFFLLGGLAALRADGLLADGLLEVGAAATAAALALASALHVYWAVGGRWLFDRATPAGFVPGRWLTFAVAVALAVFAALVLVVASGSGPAALRPLVAAGAMVLVLRAVGDAKIVGFTKTIRGTPFADADDRYFTPLVVFLALGSTGAVLG
ncbi:MAG: DUF3995 domain-containing protein [Dermatophilaceae bacterium]